jgi:hypothetical protein
MLFEKFGLTLLQLKASFDGLRLILIGDLHEQPVMHLKIKPFIVGAKDWSGEVGYLCSFFSQLTASKKLHATTTMATSITYWNLSNSHWEPRAYRLLCLTDYSQCAPFSDRSVDIHYRSTFTCFKLERFSIY